MLKNTAGQTVAFQMIDASDGSNITTGAAVTVIKDNGSSVAGGGTLTHKDTGTWTYAPTQAETNCDHLILMCTATGAFKHTINIYLSSIDYTDATALLDAAGMRTALGMASANLDTQLSTIDTNVDAILVDTNELQGDWVNGGRLDLILDTAAAAGGGGLDAAGVRAAIGLASANLDDQLGSGQLAYPNDDNNDGGIPGVNSAITKTGSSTETFVNTQASDTTYQVLVDDGDIDWLYKLNIGAGNTPGDLSFTGIAGNSHSYTFKAYDFDTSLFDTIFTHVGNGSAATQSAALSSEYVGTSASEAGNVYIRIESSSGGNLSVDALSVEYSQVRLTQADVRQALGMATADLDSQLAAIDTVVDTILVDTATTIPGTITTLQADVDAILVDTGTTIPATITTIDNEIATLDTALDGHIAEWANGGRLDNLLDTAGAAGLSQADVRSALGVPSGTLENDLDAVKTVVDAILVDTGTTIPGTITSMQANVTSILEDTGTTLDTKLNTISTNVTTIDGIVDAILLDTGTTIPGTISTIDTNVDAILVDTNELQGDWVDGGRLDLILDTAAAGGGGGLDAAGVRSAIGLASANLDTQLSTIDNEIATIDTNVDAILVDTGTTIPATLTTIDNEIATIDTNVDAILVDTNELQGDWVDGGRLDLILDAVSGGGLDAAGVRAAIGLASANLDTQLSTIDTNVDAILVDTNELQGDWVDGGRLDLILDAVSGGGLDAAGVRAAIGLASANLDTQLSTIDSEIATIDGIVDDILVDTATTLPAAISAAGISQADVRTAVGLASANLDAQLSAIDTNVDAILVDTGTTIPDTLTIIDTNVDDIETATTASAIRAAVGLANADIDTQFANLGGNIGSGANTVTITVQEDVGSTPLQAATVRATLGGTTVVGTTDVNGEVAFALDSGTWDINVTATGYSSLVSQSLVVSTTTAQTYQLTLTSTIPAPASPNVATGVLTAFDHEGQEEAGVVFSVKLTTGPGVTGQSHDTQGREFTSDSAGLVTCPNLVRAATYSIQRTNGTTQTFVVPDVSSFTIPVTGLLGFETTP